MERIVRQNLLYDFYGELLTGHQRQIYEDAIFNDMSLSEISENYGITRQGVHDIIKRCDKALQGYEDKLHLMERFERVRACAAELKDLIGDGENGVLFSDTETKKRFIKLTDAILNEI